MKKRSIATLFVLLIFVSLSSVQAYTNEKHGFLIDPPSGWTVDDTNPKAVVIFQGPLEEGFIVNVNIQVESTTMTLEQYVSAGKKLLPNALSNYTLESERNRVINQLDAYELVYTFTQAGFDVKIKQVLLVKYGKAFVITYAALLTTYQKYLSSFEASVETFKIIEQTPWHIKYWFVWVIIAVIVMAPLAFYLKRRRVAKEPHDR
jgi:hypothetical protein